MIIFRQIDLSQEMLIIEQKFINILSHYEKMHTFAFEQTNNSKTKLDFYDNA